jgi:F0F1-type ATP synthase beta subunit
MFERHKQIRTKSPLFFPDSAQISAFEQQRKKTLREILCLLGFDTLSPNEAINRSPISAAKLLQRFLSRWRFVLCG